LTVLPEVGDSKVEKSLVKQKGGGGDKVPLHRIKNCRGMEIQSCSGCESREGREGCPTTKKGGVHTRRFPVAGNILEGAKWTGIVYTCLERNGKKKRRVQSPKKTIEIIQHK